MTANKSASESGNNAKSGSTVEWAMPSLGRVLSVTMLVLGIIAVGALFYRVMAGFFVPLFLAALFVVIFRPAHDWILHRVGNRPRVAAGITTTIVLMMVLLPFVLVISVAASQFTSLVSDFEYDDVSAAMSRARERLGIALPNAEQFRRLDTLANELDQPLAHEDAISHEEELAKIDEALALVRALNEHIPGPEEDFLLAESDAAAERAEQRLLEFREAVEIHGQERPGEVIGLLDAEEQFHQKGLSASASIRTWAATKLGGTFRAQLKMLANPSARDFKRLLNTGREALQPRFVSLTSATGGFLIQSVIGMVVLVIALYFFLVDGASMIRTLMRLSPLDDNYEAQLLKEFDRTSRAVVLASVLSALVQGFLAAVAFWFLGFKSVILLFLVTSMMALVPFLGAASVWVPCAIYLGAVEQRWTAAIVLAVFGMLVISSIDNVIKMFVLHGRSTLHPLFALLSVLGGVKVFGPIGILVGPMVVVFLQTLLEILNHELAGRGSDSPMETKPDT